LIFQQGCMGEPPQMSRNGGGHVRRRDDPPDGQEDRVMVKNCKLALASVMVG
jgi:hypothetical protein